MSVTTVIDRALGLMKWPVGLVALALLPGSATALAHAARHVIDRRDALFPFVAGFAGYVLLWWFAFRKPAWGSLLSTLEHEITHAIFALLTLHRVTGMKTSWRSGGHTEFIGGSGNWLISVSPYFFPTVSIAVAIALAFVPSRIVDQMMAVLGASIAYHVTSTWAETSHRQTDLRQAGLLFSLAFLPTANLIAFGALLAFAYGGTDAVSRHVAEIDASTRALFADFAARR